ncbi:MAG: hypothetical protein LBD59_07765 [Prevotellaceae bacterium]|jgi:hypothetical protein|nr:hypothetical protein [Prevotellaceae bacterium]
MKLNRLIVALIVVAAPFLTTNAQENLNQTVHVTTVYDPIISDAEKIEMPINFDDTLFRIKTTYQYFIKPQELAAGVALRPIPAAEIRENAYNDPKWLFARLGAGYPLQFLGDVYLQNTKPENMSYGLFYNHRSIWAKLDNPNGEKIPVDELNHRAGAHLYKNLEKIAFGVDGNFDQHNVLFYGYNTVAAKRAGYVFNRDSLAQSYTSFNIAAKINSVNSKETVFTHDVRLMFDMFGDNGKNRFNTGRMFSMNENTVGANLLLGFAFGEGAHRITLAADGRLFMRSLAYNKKFDDWYAASNLAYNRLFNRLYGLNGEGKDLSDNSYIVNALPAYSFSSKLIDLELGVKYTGYKKIDGYRNRISPVAKINLKLADEFVPYASISGETVMNSYRSAASENPYITPGMNMDMKPTVKTYVITGGARGNIENTFAYNIFGRYSLINNCVFYKNAPADNDLSVLGNNFDAFYDDVQQLMAGVETKLLLRPVEIALTGSYWHCIMDKLEVPFQLPAMIANLDVNVAATKSLKLNLAAGYLSEIPYFYNAANKELLCDEGFVNLSLGVEYMITGNFSIFLNAVNLLNSKRGYWHGYNVTGLNALGGITFKL